jgi:hypothetical protein
LLRKYIGAAIIPVVPAFPVVPVSQPFLLSQSSGSGFSSSLLSGCFSFPVVLAILRSFQSLKSKEIKQGEARQTFLHCPLLMLSPINFAAVPGNMYKCLKFSRYSLGGERSLGSGGGHSLLINGNGEASASVALLFCL